MPKKKEKKLTHNIIFDFRKIFIWRDVMLQPWPWILGETKYILYNHNIHIVYYSILNII